MYHPAIFVGGISQFDWRRAPREAHSTPEASVPDPKFASLCGGLVCGRWKSNDIRDASALVRNSAFGHVAGMIGISEPRLAAAVNRLRGNGRGLTESRQTG
jgi:hypothetical protein